MLKKIEKAFNEIDAQFYYKAVSDMKKMQEDAVKLMQIPIQKEDQSNLTYGPNFMFDENVEES